MAEDNKDVPSPYESTRETMPATNTAEEQAREDYNNEANETGNDPIPGKTPGWVDIPDAGKKK